MKVRMNSTRFEDNRREERFYIMQKDWWNGKEGDPAKKDKRFTSVYILPQLNVALRNVRTLRNIWVSGNLF